MACLIAILVLGCSGPDAASHRSSGEAPKREFSALGQTPGGIFVQDLANAVADAVAGADGSFDAFSRAFRQNYGQLAAKWLETETQAINRMFAPIKSMIATEGARYARLPISDADMARVTSWKNAHAETFKRSVSRYITAEKFKLAMLSDINKPIVMTSRDEAFRIAATAAEDYYVVIQRDIRQSSSVVGKAYSYARALRLSGAGTPISDPTKLDDVARAEARFIAEASSTPLARNGFRLGGTAARNFAFKGVTKAGLAMLGTVFFVTDLSAAGWERETDELGGSFDNWTQISYADCGAVNVGLMGTMIAAQEAYEIAHHWQTKLWELKKKHSTLHFISDVADFWGNPLNFLMPTGDSAASTYPYEAEMVEISRSQASKIFEDLWDIARVGNRMGCLELKKDKYGNDIPEIIKDTRADLDMDGVVDASDMSRYFAAWNSDDYLADLDASGLVDAADLGIAFSAAGHPNLYTELNAFNPGSAEFPLQSEYTSDPNSLDDLRRASAELTACIERDECFSGRFGDQLISSYGVLAQ